MYFRSVLLFWFLSFCGTTARADWSAAQAIVDEIGRGQHPGMESFVLAADDAIVGRYVAPDLAGKPPDLRSVTKSITALLIGIAIDRGEIPSVDARLVDLLPARHELLARDPLKATVTVRHLLTMRSGLDCNDWDPDSPGHEDRMYRRRDWVAFWAGQAMRATPGETFSYCTGNVIALGEVLAQATGSPVDEYAQRHLFGPLGITGPRWARWNRNRGVDTGGHLRLAPDDLLKVGQLVLDGGVAGGRRVISASWLAEMTTARTDVPGTNQRYGYLWWVDRTKSPALPSTDLWWAQGNGGSVLVVMPGVRAVLAVTGTRFNQPDALEPMFWLRDRLLPGVAPTGRGQVTTP